MKTFCETVVQDVLPVIRAILAKKLSERGFTQEETARRLGTTQPAISQYLRNLRGVRKTGLERDPELAERLDLLAGAVASGTVDHLSLSKAFCEICKKVREKKLICSSCSLSGKGCDVCLELC